MGTYRISSLPVMLVSLAISSAAAQSTDLGQTLRTQAVQRAVATASAPVINSLLAATPSAWQPSHAYIPGQAVTNGRSIYVAYVAGTSASSGGPTSQSANAIADGTVSWFFYGAAAPVISILSSDDTALTQTFINTSAAPNPNLTYTGGVPTLAAPGATDYWIQTSKVSSNPLQFHSIDVGMGFVTDSPKVEMLGFSSFPFRLIFDGQYAATGGQTMTWNHGEGRIEVDWSGVSKLHEYKLVLTNPGYLVTSNLSTGPWFEGVLVEPGHNVSPPQKKAFAPASSETQASSAPTIQRENWVVHFPSLRLSSLERPGPSLWASSSDGRISGIWGLGAQGTSQAMPSRGLAFRGILPTLM